MDNYLYQQNPNKKHSKHLKKWKFLSIKSEVNYFMLTFYQKKPYAKFLDDSILNMKKFSIILIFYFIIQVYSVVDEMFLAGEIRETSQTKVLKQLLMLNSLE